MSEITKDKLIRDYSRAVTNKEAALFVGAGMSVGAGFVDWRGLLREIAADLKLDVDEEHDLIALAQYEFNRNQNRSRLNRKIIEEFSDRAHLSENHRRIARLPIDTVWTTNYDRLLETAFEGAGKNVDVKHRQADLLHRLPYADVTIFKMHGDVSEPDDAVLIKDDYERYNSKRRLFTTRLQGDLSWMHFLFLGFSFTDPNIEYIFSRLRVLLEENAKNQPPRYCIFRKPKSPAKGANNFDKAEAEYQRDLRVLPHRIVDLGRFNIDVVLVDEYKEIDDILAQLDLRVASRSVFVSGAAYEYRVIPREKLERFCYKLGAQLIARGFTLVSGFGLGIAGACIIGAHEQARRGKAVYVGDRLRLHPFPQEFRDDEERRHLYTEIRQQLIAESGVTIFIAGNKLDPVTGTVVPSEGMREEFSLAKFKSHILIPIPCTGGVAQEVWSEMSRDLGRFFNGVDVANEFAVLEDSSKSEEQWIEAIFSIIKKVTKA